MTGLIGHINARIDLHLLEAIADRGRSLLLVGPKDPGFEPERFGALVRRPNVCWVGPKPFELLPGYLRLLDVGLVPYRDSAFNRGSFPLKTLDYLAAGRGVVATDLPSIRWLATDLVTVASGPGAFADAVDRSLEQIKSPALMARRRALAAQHGWADRAAELHAAIMDLRGQRPVPARPDEHAPDRPRARRGRPRRAARAGAPQAFRARVLARRPRRQGRACPGPAARLWRGLRREASGGQSLGVQAGGALGWSFGNTLMAKLCTVAVGIVLARLLGPHEFGTFAVASVALTILTNVNDLGVSLAIVRWPGEPREITPTVTTISVITSSALYVACYAVRPGTPLRWGRLRRRGGPGPLPGDPDRRLRHRPHRVAAAQLPPGQADRG